MSANELVVVVNALFLAPLALAGAVSMAMVVKLCASLFRPHA